MENKKLSTEGKWSNLHVEYDSSQQIYMLYTHLNGHEMPSVNVTFNEYNDVKSGKLSLEELADMAYLDWMKEHALTTEPSKSQNRHEGQDLLEDGINKLDLDTKKEPSLTNRFINAAKGLLRNALYQSAKLLAWTVDTAMMLFRRDGKGLRREINGAGDAASRMMQAVTASLRLEQGIDRIRGYLKSIYKGGGGLLRGDIRQTRETIRPIVNDITEAADVTLVQTGIGQMALNAVGRVSNGLSAAGQAMTGKREEARQQVRKMASETLDDMKGVLRSAPVHKAVDRLVEGMEKVERATKIDNKQQREVNMQQQNSDSHPRLSAIAIFTHSFTPRHCIRCKIDGIQQLSRYIRETDYFDFAVGAKSDIELAEKYYADVLKQSTGQSQNRTSSMAR